MIVRKKDRVIVLGITGKQGTFWTEKMIAYGTTIVAGVNPKRAGEIHVGVPIFASTADAVAKVGGDVAVMFIPPPMAKDAAISAAQAGIMVLVVLTEHIPAQDVMAIHAAAAKHGTRIVDFNGMRVPLATSPELWQEAFEWKVGQGRLHLNLSEQLRLEAQEAAKKAQEHRWDNPETAEAEMEQRADQQIARFRGGGRMFNEFKSRL